MYKEQKKMADNKIVLDPKTATQLELVRRGGVCNMLDFNCVQRDAFNKNFHELVTWMQLNKKYYVLYSIRARRVMAMELEREGEPEDDLRERGARRLR